MQCRSTVVVNIVGLAAWWGAFGIRTNAVAPDCILTPRVKAGFEASGASDLDEMVGKDGMPLARWGDPAEIAGPLVFLVSSLSSFMTGQTLIVDGGMNARFPHRGRNPMREE